MKFGPLTKKGIMSEQTNILENVIKDGGKVTLDNIFNQSTVPYRGKNYPLHFTIAAEMYLEQYGIHLGTLANLLTKEPTTTILRLVFAALPPDQFREGMNFETFCRMVPEKDAREMVKRVDWILACFFRQVIGEYNKQQKQSEDSHEKTSVKKN